MYDGKKTVLATLLVLTLLLLSGTGAAAPAMTGSTGMIQTPTADSLRSGQFSAGYYYWHDAGAAVAAVGLPRGMEVSAAAQRSVGGTDHGIVNLKFNLNQEALLYPAVSIGIEDVGGQGRRSVYGVISKALPYGFRIHIGTGTGRFDGMFGAIEKVLNPVSLRKKQAGFPVTSLIIEMDGFKMNYGLRMRMAHGLRLDAGWLGGAEKVYVGMTYTQ